MKLAIMQPYFFPYLGYYSLIRKTDRLILLDTVQFIRHGWIERNRILKPSEGWQYVSVPISKHSLITPIDKVIINNCHDWKNKIIRQLEHYKKKAPFYNETIKMVESALDINTTSIVMLNANLLIKTCEHLGIQLNIDIYSEMNIIIEDVNCPDEWALNICKALNADEYVNLSGGYNIFNRSKFDQANISLKFIANNLSAYNQRRTTFESGLSIIDVLMFNDIDSTLMLIDDARLFTSRLPN